MRSVAPQGLCNPPSHWHSRQHPPNIRCGASKGFGDPSLAAANSSKSKRKSKRHPANVTADKAIDRAVRIAEDGKARPVSAKEAAKGRLDYVQVRNWGSGKQDDLGSLEVDSVTTVSSDPSRPFYEQLARHLELCQARGDLAPPRGEKPLPPFEKWAFKKRHFVHFLADQLEVHHALESATLASLQPHREDLPDEPEEGEPPLVIRPEELLAAYNTRPCRALAGFTSEAGLARAAQIGADLHLIARHTQGDTPKLLSPSLHASQLAESLMNLAVAAQDEEHGMEAQDAARLELLAYLYSIQVAHLTTGMRIGAAAAERLDLLSIGATNFYSSYPEALDDPLHAFIDKINGLGDSLEPGERDAMFAALPGAFRETSRLLTALARTE